MHSRPALSLCALLCLLSIKVASAQEPSITHKTLRAALATKPIADDANRLAEQVRSLFGKEELPKGARPKVDGLEVAWAIEAEGGASAPQVVSEDNSFRLPLIRIGETNVYAAAAELTDGTAMRWAYEVDGKRFGGGNLEVYWAGPDSTVQAGVPKGKLTQQAVWRSKIFPDTERDWWVYVPAQYKSESPASVMIFQDGGGMKNYVPVVFDNLIHKGEMPITIGVFINPGSKSAADPRATNRSFEYDTLSDSYARFLLEEILPEVEKTVKLRRDAASRAVAGISSGGICAWTVAWQRPAEFGKVMSWIGSFTNIASRDTLREGGHNYPALIRKTERKPIRVFLQDGANDLDNQHGNWPLANQQMAKALAFKNYDYKFVYGQGFHSPQHGRAILPDTLRWLWRDHKP